MSHHSQTYVFFQKNMTRSSLPKICQLFGFVFPMRMYITSMFPECINHQMRPVVEWCLPTWAQGSHLWWCFRCALCTKPAKFGGKFLGGETRCLLAWECHPYLVSHCSLVFWERWWSKPNLGGGFNFYVFFKIPILTPVFSNGWLNHQPAMSLNNGLFHATVRERSAFHTLTSLSRTPVKL